MLSLKLMEHAAVARARASTLIVCMCVCRCSYIKTRHPVTRQDTVQCDQSPNLEGRGMDRAFLRTAPGGGLPWYNVDTWRREERPPEPVHGCRHSCVCVN